MVETPLVCSLRKGTTFESAVGNLLPTPAGAGRRCSASQWLH